MKIPKKAEKYPQMQRIGIRGYIEKMEREYYELQRYLPRVSRPAIWDIGCGIGGMDILFYQHYEGADMVLSDYDRIDRHMYYGFYATTSAYNDMSVTDATMKVNGVNRGDYVLDDVENSTRSLADWTFDIVMSLHSCGFHYPVTLYLDEIVRRTKPGSRLIIDLRRSKGQRDLLLSHFKQTESIDYGKNERFIGERA